MITVDASALLAILLIEPEADDLAAVLHAAGGGVISPVNLWEVLVKAEVLYPDDGRRAAERLLEQLNIDVSPATGEQARQAADAFKRFGRRTPADLNLGDCFAYALAQEQGDGLLYKGDDFPKTDVISAA